MNENETVVFDATQQTANQKEIWDDSVLIKAYDDAIEAFAQQHNIKADDDMNALLQDYYVAQAAQEQPQKQSNKQSDVVKECKKRKLAVQNEQSANASGAWQNQWLWYAYQTNVAQQQQTMALLQQQYQQQLQLQAQLIGGSSAASVNVDVEQLALPRAIADCQDENMKAVMAAWYKAGFKAGMNFAKK